MNFNKLNIVLFSLFIILNTCACVSPEKNKENYKKNHVLANQVISDSTIIDSLLSMNTLTFIGKPVDSFLKSEIGSKYKESVFIDSKPGMLAYLSLRYTDSVFVEITVVDYKYMNPFNENRNWSLDMFRKEQIFKLRILCGKKYMDSEKQ